MERKKLRIVDGKLHMSFDRKGIYLVTVIVLCSVLLIAQIISYFVEEKLHNDEILEVQGQYIFFQEEIYKLIDTGINLIHGYEAYYKTVDQNITDQSEAYLAYLTRNYKSYIRNIGIIENTTIVYNYPMEGNEKSIGVDLATIPEQSENVLKVKEQLVTIFQGPVDLIQGGQGYIIRVPMLDEDNLYWGQASIVLKAEVINERIMAIADRIGLSIAIYTDEESSHYVLGDKTVLKMKPTVFSELGDTGWIVYAVPEAGWQEYRIEKILIFVGMIVLGLLIIYIYYYNKRVHYDLTYAMNHDQLTGLYNRRYLDRFEEFIENRTIKMRRVYGILHLDVDNFKYINDTYGHYQGDLVLKDISNLLTDYINKEEAVFRIGGDEFIIISPLITDSPSLELMKKGISIYIKENFQKDEFLRMLDISIGSTLLRKETRDLDKVLREADMNMYEEKNRRKNL